LRCAPAKAYTALQDLLVTAPAALREQLAGRYKGRLLHACQQLEASEISTSPTDAMILAIRSLAARCLHLDAEAAELERHIDAITATAAPQLRAVYGVGPDTAATNHTRLHRPPPGPKAKPKTRSCGASSATSLAKSSARYTRPADQPLNSLLEHGSIWYQDDEVARLTTAFRKP
jgi:transposase